MITPATAARELLRRRAARDSLVEYARYIEVPGAPLTGDEDCEDYSPVETVLSQHHILTLEAIQRCIERPNGRLMLLMPPGSAKSTYGSVVAPSWVMGKVPSYRMIGVSYGSDMARKFGRRTRSIIKQARYQSLFSTSISLESSAADEWALENGSEYMAGGILSGITGNRADCLVAGTLVQTNIGHIPIEQIQHCPLSVKVLSFNHNMNVMEYQDIEAFTHRKGIGIYRVTTARGAVVESTGNHKFYTARGYVKAASLAPGDSLLCQLPKGEGEASFRLSEVGEALRPGSLLLPAVQSGTRVLQRSPEMRGMRESDREEDAAILQHLPSDIEEVAACHLSSDFPRLSDLQQDIQGEVERQEGWRLHGVLQPHVRGYRPFQEDEREKQSYVERRGDTVEGTAAFCAGIQSDEAADSREGWLQVRDMRRRTEAACPSHRQLADEQRVYQSDYPVPALPQGSAPEPEWEAEQDYVVSVERIGAEASVFDIQVSKNHNFFANGILVHNCVVVDDPFKGRQDADSEAIRSRTIAEYEESVLTRLKPSGSVIIINTRWHTGDLSGHILPEGYQGQSGLIRGRDGEDWEVLCLAAKCERADDPLGRAIGEYIWPEWFGPEHWGKFERLPRTWSALFQQRPAPDTGDYFKADWLIPVDHMPPVEQMSIYGGSDYAVTSNGGDYTVHAVIGVCSANNIYLLDLWRQQTASDVWVDSFCALVRKWKPIGWAEETGQIKSGVGPFLIKRMIETGSYVAREQFPTRGDKAARAQSIRGMMAMKGLRYHRDAPWFSDFKAELMSFPVGVHDDQVDAIGLVGQLIDRMATGDKGKRNRRDIEHMFRVTADGIMAPPL